VITATNRSVVPTSAVSTTQTAPVTNRIVPFGNFTKIGIGGQNVVMLKFEFTNSAHIPPGIPRSDRPDNTVLDFMRESRAIGTAEESLARVGRVREGRVDTGTHFINNVHNVHAGVMTRGLANSSFELVQSYWYKREGRDGHCDKYVVVLTFVHWTVKDRTKIDSAILKNATEQRRALARITWQWCHGWSNPDGTITLNFGGRQPDAKAQNAVVVRDHAITAAKIDQIVTEEDEAGQVAK